MAPGCEREIIGWVTAYNEHRRYCEREELAIARDGMREAIRTQRLGMWLGFTLALVFAAVGAAAIFTGREVGGAAVLITAIGSLVAAFRQGLRHRGSVADRDPRSRD